ncbi:MAG: hypothetical protein ACRDJE_07680 [Dehalococcoidia bacterium]
MLVSAYIVARAVKWRASALEKAALIRDQIVELRRELADDEEGLSEIAKIIAPPRRAERPLVSGSTNRQNRARRRCGG